MKKFKSNWVETYILPILGGFGCISLLIFIILSIPIYIFRFLVILFAKYFRPDLGEIINGPSNIFVNELFGDKPLRSNIIICHAMTGHFTLDEMKSLVWNNWIHAIDKQSGQLKFAKFQQYPVKWCGFGFYKNAFDVFNIDNHVHCHETLGGGKSPSVTEEDAVDFTEKLLNASYRPRTSPWELHLVQNYINPKISSEEMSLLILKTHHSLADGYSLLECAKALIDCPMTELKMPIAKRFHSKESLPERILHWLTFPFLSFYELSLVLGQILRKSSWKVPDHEKEWHQYCAKSEIIPVKTVSEIKNAFGVTFTSVLASSLSTAISKHFETKTQVGMGAMQDDSLFCLSVLPLIGHKKILTNHATGSMFNIPTSRFSDPLERLRTCYGALEASSKSPIPYLLPHYTTVLGCHLNFVGNAIVKNRVLSTGLSNFPSLPFAAEKNGKVFISQDFVVGCLEGCCGVGVMILSYNGNIRVVISAEKAIMSKKETKEFVANIKEEIDLLHGIALAKRTNNISEE